MSAGLIQPGDADYGKHPFHQFANLFPMLGDAELADLGEDIAENGQVETVKLHRGMILDGRNRYTAASRKGLPIRYELFEGSDRQALDYVVSKNLKRRHLDEDDRLRIAGNIGKLKFGANQHTRQRSPIGEPALQFTDLPAPTEGVPLSQAERAELMQVSKRGVERVDAVYDKGAPELQKVFEDKSVPVSVAADIASHQSPEQQKALLESLPRDAEGKLTPAAKKEIRKVAKEVRTEDQAEKKRRRDEREKKLGEKIRALPDVKAGLILSDFEWHFKVHSEETGMDRHAANHYVTAKDVSTPEAIVERQRERMSIAADDCIHLMWTTAAFLAVALKVMELQGFKYVSHFIWIKPGIGTGFWVRENHEILLIGVRGKIPCPAMGDQFNSAIEAPRGEHSEKPDFQYEIAEKHFPSLPKVELNARRARDGWIQWGNEAPEQSSLLPAEAAE